MNLQRIYVATLLGLSVLSMTVNADTLQQVYETAKNKDPIILKSKAQYDAFAEKINESSASLLPQIAFAIDADRTAANSENLGNDYLDKTVTSASLSLSQSLYNSAYWQQTDIAKKQATQYAAIYGYAKQYLLFRTSSAYFNVLRADESVKSVKANKRAVERQLEQTKQRFDVGLIAITDVHEAQAEYDRTVVDLINAENTLANNYYLLRELTGENVKKVAYLDTKTFSPQAIKGDTKYWRANALEHNLNLHSLRIAKELAKLNIGLAQSGHGPTLDLTAGLGHYDYGYDSASRTSYDANIATIGLSLTVPIFSGGATSSKVKQAQYNYVMASQDLEQIYRSIDAQINNGYNNVQASISSIKAYKQAVVSSRSALDAAEASFEVGTRTVVDVLDSTRNLYSSENQLANARYDYIINMLQLKLSAGTLVEQDIFDISTGLTEVIKK